jgi:hypothetical protein
MHRRETERLLIAIRQAQAAADRVALATVVRVKGSAYRREGTRMLVRQNGTYECALSGGCLEPAVADAALRVIDTGEARVVTYDLAEDSLWGLGMGCSGAVDVRIERLDDDAMLRAWLAVLERGDAAVLITPLAGTSGRMLVRGTGEIVGGLDDSAVQREATAHARELLRGGFPQSGPAPIGGSEILTSNRTRELSDALRRRCLFLWLPYPSVEQEIAILHARVPDLSARLAQQIARVMHVLRGLPLQKAPGVAESVDWALALLSLHRDHLDAHAVDQTLGCVLKVHEDHAVLHAHHAALEPVLDGAAAFEPGGHGRESDFGFGSVSTPRR